MVSSFADPRPRSCSRRHSCARSISAEQQFPRRRARSRRFVACSLCVDHLRYLQLLGLIACSYCCSVLPQVIDSAEVALAAYASTHRLCCAALQRLQSDAPAVATHATSPERSLSKLPGRLLGDRHEALRNYEQPKRLGIAAAACRLLEVHRQACVPGGTCRLAPRGATPYLMPKMTRRRGRLIVAVP